MTAERPAGDERVYRVIIQEPLDDEFVVAFCPAGTQRTRLSDVTVLARIRTDQAGIVGLMRHLHNLGCTIVSLGPDQKSAAVG